MLKPAVGGKMEDGTCLTGSVHSGHVRALLILASWIHVLNWIRLIFSNNGRTSKASEIKAVHGDFCKFLQQMQNFLKEEARCSRSRGVNQQHCSNICSYKCDPPTEQLPSSCSKWAISFDSLRSNTPSPTPPTCLTLKLSILNVVK